MTGNNEVTEITMPSVSMLISEPGWFTLEATLDTKEYDTILISELFRYGGDEFIAIFRNIALETILSGIKAVRIALGEHYKGADLSYGFINNENNILNTLLEADRRMYEVKKEKKAAYIIDN